MEKFKKAEKAVLMGGLLVLLFVLWRVPLSVWGLAIEEKTPPATQTRTEKYFIIQEPAVLITPTSTTTDFTISLWDSSPVIKDAYVEVRGVTKASASQAIKVDFRSVGGSVCTESFPNTQRAKTFTLDSSSQPNHFRLLYAGIGTSTDSSLLYCLNNRIIAAGSYDFQLRIDISGADVSALQARMVLTYQFTPPTESAGGLPATGEIVSPTFDTYAVNGANYNWILWKGNAPSGTKVRLQLATSDASGGPFTFIGRSGTTCNSTLWYEPLASTQVEIGCASNHNNKRYYRYKVQLCSSTNCSTAGSLNPQVDDVIVNWSP